MQADWVTSTWIINEFEKYYIKITGQYEVLKRKKAVLCLLRLRNLCFPNSPRQLICFTDFELLINFVFKLRWITGITETERNRHEMLVKSR